MKKWSKHNISGLNNKSKYLKKDSQKREAAAAFWICQHRPFNRIQSHDEFNQHLRSNKIVVFNINRQQSPVSTQLFQ